MYGIATKSSTITEDASDRLKSLKREEESFSEPVVGLTDQADFMVFAGSCPRLGAYGEAARSGLDEDLEERQDTLFG
ncbi:MAG: antitoxin VapB family protein [Haloarculaceae archaeon]